MVTTKNKVVQEPIKQPKIETPLNPTVLDLGSSQNPENYPYY